ncbi:IS110 family transposase [Bradyrhizobium sp. Arg68]|uniref:IS110 family transposase n=1 Tax=Bradyrhizobium ivorense TaxID=2511166 RepID=UPI001E593034|nr:IS110 family transposase [Bradyrhizobium ivorense]MCC8936595.1 IS110 family transposase [Bradyrhizobium ivorense]
MTEDIAAYVGVDWASATQYAYALDAKGAKLGHCSFEHSGVGLADLADWIQRTTGAEPGRIAIGIEVPHGPVVESLMDSGFLVHALNPKQLDRFRDRFTMAGAKDDRLDAFVLADALRTDSRFYRFLEPVHPTIIQLREWSRMTEDLSTERNRLANRFRHQLWRYFPQMLGLAEDWSQQWILDLWDLIPTPARARTVRASTIERRLKESRVKRWTADTLLTHLRSTPVSVAAGVTEACVVHCQLILGRLRLVMQQMKLAMKELERLCSAVAELPSATGISPQADPEILRSMPGIGTIVLAALLSEGHDAIVRRDAQALRGLSGVVPVTRRSGKQIVVVMRQSCPHRLRTAVYHWARVAVLHDFQTRNRYAALRKRGHSHARALRSIGSRLIGVACAMLRTGELFDRDRTPQFATA